MNKPILRALLSFISLQLGWFACVLGAARGAPWLGPLVVLVTLTVHVFGQAKRGPEMAMLVGAALVGFIVETALLRAGLTQVAGAHLAPPWLVALWPNFAATTAPGSTLSGLAKRPRLAALLGALLGPLAYVSGARLGALVLVPPQRVTLLVIGVVWAAFVPLAFWIRGRVAGVH